MKVPEWSGQPDKFVDWRSRMANFLQQEGEFRAVLHWIEEHAMRTPDDPTMEVLSMLPAIEENTAGASGRDPWAEGRDAEAEEARKKKMMELGPNIKPLVLSDRTVRSWSDPVLGWHGQAMLQCFSANFQGKRQSDMLRNLEHVRPVAAQGIEVWFRVVREARGAAGPRRIRLAADIFHPPRAKLENVNTAWEAWEADVYEFELAGQPRGTVLRMTGLCQLLPKDLQSDLHKFRHLLTSYPKARTWVAGQVVNGREDSGGKRRPEVNEVEEAGRAGGEECEPVTSN